jgi:hypothetical protein
MIHDADGNATENSTKAEQTGSDKKTNKKGKIYIIMQWVAK